MFHVSYTQHFKKRTVVQLRIEHSPPWLTHSGLQVTPMLLARKEYGKEGEGAGSLMAVGSWFVGFQCC